MTTDLRNQPLPLIPSRGFVVAMRAKLVGTARPSLFEWILVSRWGTSGEYLSIAWTSRAAPTRRAPIDLTPRHAVVAVRREPGRNWTPATFVLCDTLPDRMTVAGEFLPAQGYVRLRGQDARLRLRSKGTSQRPELRPAWHVDATREAWIGEFIEAGPE